MAETPDPIDNSSSANPAIPNPVGGSGGGAAPAVTPAAVNTITVPSVPPTNHSGFTEHLGKTFRIESRLDGKTDQDGGDQFLFGNFLEAGGWSAAHGNSVIGLANNFHAWWGAEDVIRVEFEADQGELQFYIEAGVGKDAWYGVQESSTHHWSFGHDAGANAFAFCAGFGLNSANYIWTISNITKAFKLHTPLEPTGGIGATKVTGLHRPVTAHRTCLIQEGDGGKDGVLQIAAQNGGGVGTAIVMTGQESTADGRHWVMQHRGAADGNRFEIGYKTTVTDGENIVGSVAEIMGISTDGKVAIQKLVLSGVPTSDPVNAGEVWNDVGTLKISAG
mgnify:CR=1 FL=1